MAESSYVIANYQVSQENFYPALENYLSVLHYFQSTNDNSKKEIICIRIASLYLEIENFEYSLKYSDMARTFAERSGSAYDLGLIYFVFAIYYYQTEEISLALSKLDSAFVYGKKSKSMGR